MCKQLGFGLTKRKKKAWLVKGRALYMGNGGLYLQVYILAIQRRAPFPGILCNVRKPVAICIQPNSVTVVKGRRVINQFSELSDLPLTSRTAKMLNDRRLLNVDICSSFVEG